MWKELFEGEGIPTRLLPASDEPMGQESAVYRVLVPEDKKHVIEEVLRNLCCQVKQSGSFFCYRFSPF